MPEPRHRVMSTGQVRDDLAELYRSAPVELRAKINAALAHAESTITDDPISCSAPLFDLPHQALQARVAFFLPLALYFAVDEKKREVYMHKIDVVSESQRPTFTKSSAC
jgi:hypothetical protein